MTTASLLSSVSTAASGAATQEAGTVGMIVSLLPMILIIVVFYFILIRPQKKRDKETAKMRSNLEVGDEIITIGGVIGRVVSLKEETVVIETGSDRSKIRFLRSAIQQNNTALERAAEEKAAKDKAAKEQVAKAKEEK